MKNLPLILSALALVGVTYLLATGLSSKAEPMADNSAAAAAGPSIVFINQDSLLSNYGFFKNKQEELAAKEQEAESQLEVQGRSLEKEVQAVQRKMQQGLLTPNQIAQEEQRLGKKQQELMQRREVMAQGLMQETQVLTDSLQSYIRTVLKGLKDERGYDFILNYGPGTGVVMVNDSLDITREVLQRLNKKEGN